MEWNGPEWADSLGVTCGLILLLGAIIVGVIFIAAVFFGL